jgi:hypothetical protein
VTGASNLEELKDRTSKQILRRLKENVLDLPDKIITPVYLRTSSKEYKDLMGEYYEWLKNKTDESSSLTVQFSKLMKVRKVIANEKVKDTIDDYNKRFAKKVKYKNNYIEFFVAYDNSDGYFISFRIINIDNQYVDSLNDEFKSLFNILYNLNKGFNHNSQYLGYINHQSFSFFDRLEPEIIFKLDNYEYRNEFIQKIFNEGLDYCDALEYFIIQNELI